MKKDTKLFYQMWQKQPLWYRIFGFLLKSTAKEFFEIGFTHGVDWTIDEKRIKGVNIR